MKCYNAECKSYDKYFTESCRSTTFNLKKASECPEFIEFKPCPNCESTEIKELHFIGIVCKSCGCFTGKCKTLAAAKKQWNGE